MYVGIRFVSTFFPQLSLKSGPFFSHRLKTLCIPPNTLNMSIKFLFVTLSLLAAAAAADDEINVRYFFGSR